MRLLASTLVPPQRITQRPPREHTPTGPVLWPRWQGGKIEMTPIDPARIPAGWQSINVRVPMRMASCEETECPNTGRFCDSLHKVPSGLPPVYIVDGRTVLWNEFEDSLGGGVHRMAQNVKEGSY